MNYFNSQYQAGCKALVAPYGFKRKNKGFVRVINDVCQSFDMEKLSRGPGQKACRIGFVVRPLCQPLNVQQVERGGLYYLKKFEICDDGEPDGWRYKYDPESISLCIEEVMRYISAYMIPFFERATCTKSAFSELIALEKLFNENRVAYLNLKGIEDGAGPDAELNLFDGAKYYMALKNGNYDYAMKSRSAVLQLNLVAYESEKGFLPEEVLAERREVIQRLHREIELLDKGDYDFFRNLVEENEAISKENLKKFM